MSTVAFLFCKGNERAYLNHVAVGFPRERLPDMFSHDLPEFLGRTDISQENKRAILHDKPGTLLPARDLISLKTEELTCA